MAICLRCYARHRQTSAASSPTLPSRTKKKPGTVMRPYLVLVFYPLNSEKRLAIEWWLGFTGWSRVPQTPQTIFFQDHQAWDEGDGTKAPVLSPLKRNRNPHLIRFDQEPHGGVDVGLMIDFMGGEGALASVGIGPRDRIEFSHT